MWPRLLAVALLALCSEAHAVNPHGYGTGVTSVACSGLPANNTWAYITPPGATLSGPYQGPLVTLIDPNHVGTIYSYTYTSGVFKSTNCGTTWVKINTGTNGSTLDGGRLWSAVINPTNSNMYTLTGYGAAGLWESTDGGVDWTDILPSGTISALGFPASGFVGRVQMDPTNPLHLAITFHDNCVSPNQPVCFGITTDGGATWSAISLPTMYASSWAEGMFLVPLSASKLVLQMNNVFYSGDGGTTWSQSTSASADTEGGIYTDPNGNYWASTALGQIYSTNGSTWSTVANSGSQTGNIVGCGTTTSIYAGAYFSAPSGTNYVYYQTLANALTTAWNVAPNTGLTTPLSAGFNDMECDSVNKVIYVAAQGVGLLAYKVP